MSLLNVQFVNHCCKKLYREKQTEEEGVGPCLKQTIATSALMRLSRLRQNFRLHLRVKLSIASSSDMHFTAKIIINDGNGSARLTSLDKI